MHKPSHQRIMRFLCIRVYAIFNTKKKNTLRKRDESLSISYALKKRFSFFFFRSKIDFFPLYDVNTWIGRWCTYHVSKADNCNEFTRIHSAIEIREQKIAKGVALSPPTIYQPGENIHTCSLPFTNESTSHRYVVVVSFSVLLCALCSLWVLTMQTERFN